LLPEFFNEEGCTNGKAKNASVYWRDEVLSPPSLSKAEANLMAFHGLRDRLYTDSSNF
jgi:hypothetical protein